MSDVLYGNTSVQRRGPQELHSVSVAVGEGLAKLRMEYSHRIVLVLFCPRHHAEVPLPWTQAAEHHPLLQPDRLDLSLQQSSWTEMRGIQ